MDMMMMDTQFTSIVASMARSTAVILSVDSLFVQIDLVDSFVITLCISVSICSSRFLEFSECITVTDLLKSDRNFGIKFLHYLSRVVRKPAFCICEYKNADQLRGNREADQGLCFRYLDSTIPLLPKSEISSL